MDRKMMIKLKEAGVSSDIILGLLLDEEPAAAAAPEEKPEVKPEPEAKPDPKPQDPDPILKAIQDLTGVIQASNILRTGREAEKAPTADDVLAEILSGKKGV